MSKDRPRKEKEMKRIQRKRTKGWKMPKNCLYVGRPTKWGNNFDTLDEYETWLTNKVYLDELDLAELKGKNLCCWCSLDKPCHADILIEYTEDFEKYEVI